MSKENLLNKDYQEIQMPLLSSTKKVLLVMGLCQVGKSSFINVLAGRNLAEEGKGIGEATTKKVTCYPSIDING